MLEFLNFFNQAWVGSFIGLVGITVGLIGLVLYRLSRNIAEPSYQNSSLRLIGEKENNLPKEVEVTYNGRVVERLTKTTLIFWNNGTAVIDGKDIIASDPITIVFDKNDNILSYKILKCTKNVNNFSIVKYDDHPYQLLLNFDYLDPKDGAVLEILHDGREKYPRITGTIKGLPKGFINQGIVYENEATKIKGPIGILLDKRTLLLTLMVFFGVAMVVVGLAGNRFFSTESDLAPAVVALGVIYAVLPALLLWYRRKKYPKQLEIVEIEP